MVDRKSFEDVYERLRAILAVYTGSLVTVHDTRGHLHLDTTHIMKNKKPLFFAAVQIRKSYVSFHLMPVYVYPELLDSISGDLKRRMQGKSCFNFTAVDEPLFAELAELTLRGFDAYKEAGYVVT